MKYSPGRCRIGPRVISNKGDPIEPRIPGNIIIPKWCTYIEWETNTPQHKWDNNNPPLCINCGQCNDGRCRSIDCYGLIEEMK